MDAGTEKYLKALKNILHTLKDSGADGFEGLLASVLSEVCGQPFHLASSGSQRGRDGDSAFDDGATYFEAKLYQGTVPRAAVSTKILDLILDDEGQVDTWALCATSAISAQHANAYRRSLAEAGIGCLILDWPEYALPPLAVLLAMTPANTERFILDHSMHTAGAAVVRAHLDGIAGDSQFPVVASKLRDLLSDPVLGLGLSKLANKAWLTQAFSDRRLARQHFGQPLAPLDPAGLSWVDRTILAGDLTGAFVGTPNETVYLVIGEEGTGKSWLASKAWLLSTSPPLFVVFTADQLQMPMALHDIEGTIIQKLATQTGGVLTDNAKRRWQRRFKGWRANSKPANIRLAVLVDGLNQAQGFPWPHWIDAAATFLESIGGSLIVTTNERHFAQRLRSTVTSKVRRVIVKEWSDEELKMILKARGISANRLSADVFNFLRNPRILGIAVELLDANDIERFEELTVGRLLFEHIMRCERDGITAMPAFEFAGVLRKHADDIIERLSGQQHDDLKLFDAPIDARLRAVSHSRFFAAVPGEPDRYAIKDEGLPLALGLSVVGILRKEHRNGRDPAVRLSQIAEPVLALAATSEVILSALQVACLDPDCPAEIPAALARYYASLQNLPESQWPAFEALVRSAPEPFVRAARDAALSGDHLANMQRLTEALAAAQSRLISLPATLTHVQMWLAYYSLAPERGMHANPRNDPREKVEAERAKRQGVIEARLSELTADERTFVETQLVRHDGGNLSGLHQVAFKLLAGTKLAGLSDAFVRWAFAKALNPCFYDPDREFAHLIRLNAVDWAETRDALLHSAALFMKVGTSRTGRWALVTILRATGDSGDAARAEEIADELTRDWEKLPGWRRIESYCATDPCDPASVCPENIGKTASAFEAVDVASLSAGMGSTAQDHFFSDARPGVARFAPHAAVHTLRRFAHNVAIRPGRPRRQGILELSSNSAVLDPKAVEELIAVALAAHNDDSSAESEGKDGWITAQYALVSALPHKTGNEQLEIIASLHGRSLLISMLEQTRPADEVIVERHIARAIQRGDPDALVRVLSFIQYSRSSVSVHAKQNLMTLFDSPDGMVRSFAFGIAARLRDPEMLKRIADSDWDAGKVGAKEDFYERWYGSAAILAAAEAQLIDPVEAVERVSPTHYGYAARRLPGPGANMAAARIDAALRKAAGLTTLPEIPLIERPVRTEADNEPPLLSLLDEPRSLDIRTFFDRINESDESFRVRQERAWKAFERFRKDVTNAEATLIIDDVSWTGIEAIVAAEPSLADSWVMLLESISGWHLGGLHFFGLGLARAMTRIDPMRAAKLFQKLSSEEPSIRRIFEPSKVPAESVALWSCANVTEIRTLCYRRLDEASDDSRLAVEVLAAFSQGRQSEITEYVDAKLKLNIPSTIGRALMVSGFSDSNPHAEDVLNRFAGQKGFLGKAVVAARFAYYRNLWARHWFAQMKSAGMPEEFWCNSILFLKIVDSRYALWYGDGEAGSTVFQSFFPTVRTRINNRLKTWQDKRQKTLFGQEAPDPVFLRGA
jgi:hypothetical protein